MPRILRTLARLIALASDLCAGDPPTQPILRLETGIHTAMIPRIGADAAGRILVTCSYDKTSRIWDLASARSLHPIAATNEVAEATRGRRRPGW